jgi:hypothetical protein
MTKSSTKRRHLVASDNRGLRGHRRIGAVLALSFAVAFAGVSSLPPSSQAANDGVVIAADPVQGDAHRFVETGSSAEMVITAPADAESVSWSTSAPGVLRVDGSPSGASVTGLNEGIATIRVDVSTPRGASHDEVIFSVGQSGFSPVSVAYIKARAVELTDADATSMTGQAADEGAHVRLLAASRGYYRAQPDAGLPFWIARASVRVPATAITVRPTSLLMSNKSTTFLTAVVEPAIATDPVAWTSTNPQVAAVAGKEFNAGVRAMRLGRTKIRATVSGLKAVVAVRVAKPAARFAKSRVCVLGWGKCGWDAWRHSGSIVHVKYSTQLKINNDHEIEDWLLDKAIFWGHRTESFPPDNPDHTAYSFTAWEWKCYNGECVPGKRWVDIHFVVDWWDGEPKHGRLVTMFCHPTPGDACPSWLSYLEPKYFGKGPQNP